MFKLLTFWQRWSISWIDEWMKDREFARLLSFNEWIEFTEFETSFNKSLSKIVTILIKVDDTSLHVDTNTNDTTNIEVTVRRLWITVGSPLTNGIVVGPSLACINITSSQIHTPKVTCSRNILVKIESVSTNSNDNFRMNTFWVINLINSKLEVESVSYFLKWNFLGFVWLGNLISMPIIIVPLRV